MTELETLMKTLNLTEEEARELQAYDRDIDNGKASPYDLDEEHAKVAKEMANVETHKMRKKTVIEEDITKTSKKAKILLALSEFLANSEEINAENINFLNVERQLTFNVGSNNYEIILTQKRSK